MSSIKEWYKIVTDNELHACNRVSSRDLALCFNFLQIPDTETIAVTVTVMKNKVKKNSLSPDNFARIMNCIEGALETTSQEYSGLNEYDKDNVYFVGVKQQLNNQWYIHLCCHRIFFIPVGGLWITIKNLFEQSEVQYIKSNGITELSVLINTEDYDCNARFY